KWIFTVGFLSTSPPRISKDVDVGRPEIETLKNIRVSGTLLLHVLNPSFNADCCRHLVNAWRVERSRQTDGFGKFGGAIHRNAVQGLAPPVVRRNIESRDGARL